MSKLNDWLQLAAALGVIAGLWLVATEIQQNADLTRAQLNSDSLTSWEQLARSMQQEPLARALVKAEESPLELTLEEQVILAGFYNEQLLATLTRELTLMRRGVYEDQLDIYAMIFARRVLSNEFGRAWWEETGASRPTEITARVERALAAMPAALGNIRRIDEILKNRIEGQQ